MGKIVKLACNNVGRLGSNSYLLLLDFPDSRSVADDLIHNFFLVDRSASIMSAPAEPNSLLLLCLTTFNFARL